MSNHSELTTLQKMALALKKLEGKINSMESEPIAVIGMACRFPGGITTPEEYWKFLLEGKCAISDIPKSRWDNTQYYNPDKSVPEKMYVNRGGFLTQEIDKFDPIFFNISPKEANDLDPQQRIALEVCWEALENACIPPESLSEVNMGVFMGLFKHDYELNILTSENYLSKIHAYHESGNTFCMLPGRIAYIFGINGPTMAVDTACSSSLVTADLACMNLRLRQCDVAFAGGVNINLSPIPYISRSKASMLSPEGYCKSFDASANGYVLSEGCGVVVLKRLSDALKNKDPVLAVISGSSVNHGGASSGLMVPNAVAQTKLIKKALVNSKVDPHKISYIECHGTGTAVGDPIEYNGLCGAFEGKTDKENPIVLGSVKANLGHLEPAAGVASLIKVVLMLQHHMIPKQILLNNLNPNIDLDRLPAKITQENLPWGSEDEVNFAGISSFGFGGTNAHLILRNITPEEKSQIYNKSTESADDIFILPISAKEKTSLLELAKNYKEYLENSASVSMGDICYSAAIGREHFKFSIITWGTRTEIINALNDFHKGTVSNNLCYSKDTSPHPVEKKDNYGKINEILEKLSENSFDIDWNKYYEGSSYNKVLLPNYCFNRQSYWVKSKYTSDEKAPVETPLTTKKIRNLLGTKTYSPYFTAGYENTLSLSEFPYLDDHRVYENPMFPAAGFLELMISSILSEKKRPVELNNIDIKKGLILKNNEEIRIQTLIGEKYIGPNVITVYSQEQGQPTSEWHEHISAAFHDIPDLSTVKNLEDLKKKFAKTIDTNTFYSVMKNSGLDYRQDFQSIKTISYSDLSSIGTVKTNTDIQQFSAYPALLDSCFQVMLASIWDKLKISDKNSTIDILIPMHIESLSVYDSLRNDVFVEVLDVDFNESIKSIKASINIYDTTGKLLIHLKNFTCRHIPKEVLMKALSEQHHEPLKQQQPAIIETQTTKIKEEILYQTSLQIKPLTGQTSLDWQKPSWLYYSEDAGLNELLPHAKLLQKEDLISRERISSLVENPELLNSYQGTLIAFNPLTVDSSFDATKAQDLLTHTKMFFELLKGLLKNTYTKNKPIVIITRGVFSEENKASNPLDKVITAMMRVMALENVSVKVNHIDLSPQLSTADSLQVLQAELTSQLPDLVVHYSHKKERFILKLMPLQTSQKALSLRPDAPYVITGGLGGIGLALTEWLISKGAKRIILIGRSAPKAESLAFIHKYAGTDITLLTLKGDISNYTHVKSLLADIKDRYSSIAGIFHAAGVLKDSLFDETDWQQFQEVLSPKCLGALNLHYALSELSMNVDYMVYFSSITSVLGTAGQMNYAAANAFLDGLANYRNLHGLRTLSVNWGPWGEIGMAASLDALMNRKGYIPLKPKMALEIMGDVLADKNIYNLMVSTLNWNIVGNLPGLDKNLIPETSVSLKPVPSVASKEVTEKKIEIVPEPTIISQNETPKTEFLSQYLSLQDSQKQEYLVHHLSNSFRKILELPDGFDVDINAGFFDSGMDSLMAVDYRNALQTDLGDSINLSSTLLFDYVNINALATYLMEALSSLKASVVSAPVEAPVQTPQPITQAAVIPEVPAKPAISLDTEFLQGYFEISENDRKEFVVNYLTNVFRKILEIPASFDVDTHQGFFDSGMDSLMAVDYRNLLQGALGNSINLNSTLLFDYSNIDELSSYLITELKQSTPSQKPPVASVNEPSVSSDETDEDKLIAEARKILGEDNDG